MWDIYDFSNRTTSPILVTLEKTIRQILSETKTRRANQDTATVTFFIYSGLSGPFQENYHSTRLAQLSNGAIPPNQGFVMLLGKYSGPTRGINYIKIIRIVAYQVTEVTPDSWRSLISWPHSPNRVLCGSHAPPVVLRKNISQFLQI